MSYNRHYRVYPGGWDDWTNRHFDSDYYIDISPDAGSAFPVESFECGCELYGGNTFGRLTTSKAFGHAYPFELGAVVEFNAAQTSPGVPQSIYDSEPPSANARHYVGEVVEFISSYDGSATVELYAPVLWLKEGNQSLSGSYTGTLRELLNEWIEQKDSAIWSYFGIGVPLDPIGSPGESFSEKFDQWCPAFSGEQISVEFDNTNLFDAITEACRLEPGAGWEVTPSKQFRFYQQATSPSYTYRQLRGDPGEGTYRISNESIVDILYLTYGDPAATQIYWLEDGALQDSGSIPSEYARIARVTNTALSNKSDADSYAERYLTERQSADVKVEWNFYRVSEPNATLGLTTGWKPHPDDGSIKIVSSMGQEITSAPITSIRYNAADEYTARPTFGQRDKSLVVEDNS